MSVNPNVLHYLDGKLAADRVGALPRRVVQARDDQLLQLVEVRPARQP